MKMTETQIYLQKQIVLAKGFAAKRLLGVKIIETIEDQRPHFINKSLDDIDGEIWRAIPNFPLYFISNFGRVKRENKNMLLGKIDIGGYLIFMASDYERKKYFQSHRMVAKCFLKTNNIKLDVHHKNGIKLDNRLCNVEYITRSENIRHAWDSGLNKGSVNTVGTKRYNSILNDDLVYKVRVMQHNGIKRGIVCKELDISFDSYDNIRRGAWKHIKI